jgi:hypothetical protein
MINIRLMITCGALLLTSIGCSVKKEAHKPLNERVRIQIDSQPVDIVETTSSTVAGSVLESAQAVPAKLLKSPSPVMQHWTNPLGELKDQKDMPVGLRVIDRHFDPSRVYFTVLLRNVSDKGKRVRLYAFGYDKNNRLVSTGDKALYVQPREQMVQNYTFHRSSGMTKWVLAVR